MVREIVKVSTRPWCSGSPTTTALLAIIVPRDFDEPGINFITADDASLQLGLLNHPKSTIIQPHAHKVRPREVTVTQEVLFLRKGKLRVDFYDDDETYLESRILEQGDTILLVSRRPWVRGPGGRGHHRGQDRPVSRRRREKTFLAGAAGPLNITG